MEPRKGQDQGACGGTADPRAKSCAGKEVETARVSYPQRISLQGVADCDEEISAAVEGYGLIENVNQ
jgi:hypothetical protein